MTCSYVDLVERGCLCGTNRIAACPLHVGPGDNRGLRAFYQAGMPLAFPMVATCAICGTEGLMYPDVELEESSQAPARHRPTLICPRCSRPSLERALVVEVLVTARHRLNDRRVFT